MDTHFFAGLSKFKVDAGKCRRDDDFADRFNHNFTTLLLVVFTLVVSARQYIGKPIACWVPTEFTRAQEEYAESVCWVTSTYFLPTRQTNVPESTVERDERKILYYQWVPFILMIQAFLFNLPCILWRLFNWQSGIHLSSIMEVSCDIEMIRDPESRKSNIKYIARHIEDALSSQREYRVNCGVTCRQFLAKSCCLWFGKRYGNYLICLYLITKALYILNVVGQFFLMNRILGTNYTFYGLDLIRDIAEGYLWEESGNFPRITMCDFEIRKLANKHRYTVQCVLPINMFNEKIFIFLWFWLVLVSAVSISSFLYWSYKSSFRANRIHFVRKFLKLCDSLDSGDKKNCFKFVDAYLRQDGVFILRLIAQNAGELVAAEIVDRLWQIFKHRETVHTAISPDNQSANVPSKFGWNVKGDSSLTPKSQCDHSSRCSKLNRSSHSSTNSDPSMNSFNKTRAFAKNSLQEKSFVSATVYQATAPMLPPPLPPPPGSSSLKSSSSETSSSYRRNNECLLQQKITQSKFKLGSGWTQTDGKKSSSTLPNSDLKLSRKMEPSTPLEPPSDRIKGKHNTIKEEDPGDFV